MAIGTGAASLGDIRTEWGRSGAISLSEMYRGGTHVRSKAANNSSSNLASTVPTSGVISIDDFRGSAKGFKYTFTSTATNQNASDLFGDDYAVDYPKEIIIDSGVELGATSTSEEALQIDSGASGAIYVTNNGTLTGAGGPAGSDGGDAFEANVACTFVNNGTIRSGGGGSGSGGQGGQGGGGSYTSTTTAANCTLRSSGSTSGCPVSCNSSSYVYCYQNCVSMMDQYDFQCYGKLISTTTVNTNGGAGGAGAAGAVGQGYNQAAGSGNSGSGGAAGGTNAGVGGQGGSSSAGAAFGQAGSAGNSGSAGANGNRTGGSAGSSGQAGGAAGAAIRNIANVTFTNNGTVIGGQV